MNRIQQSNMANFWAGRLISHQHNQSFGQVEVDPPVQNPTSQELGSYLALGSNSSQLNQNNIDNAYSGDEVRLSAIKNNMFIDPSQAQSSNVPENGSSGEHQVLESQDVPVIKSSDEVKLNPQQLVRNSNVSLGSEQGPIRRVVPLDKPDSDSNLYLSRQDLNQNPLYRIESNQGDKSETAQNSTMPNQPVKPLSGLSLLNDRQMSKTVKSTVISESNVNVQESAQPVTSYNGSYGDQ